MSDDDPLAFARQYMDRDAFARQLGIVREEMTPARCVCRLLLRDEHKNGADVAHGGVIFTLADYTGACLAMSQGFLTLMVNANVSFVAAAPGGMLTATAELVRAGKNLVHVRVSVVDGRERLVATLTGTAFRLAEPPRGPAAPE